MLTFLKRLLLFSKWCILSAFHSMFPKQHLLSGHRKLVKYLKKFEPVGTLQWIGGLGTVPELQANTLRLEALALLAGWKCSGAKVATDEELIQLLAPLMDESPLAPLEDPPEDVFVGCVNTPEGSFKVFPGIYADGDFWVERLLVFLSEKTNFPGFSDLQEEALSLLRLSDSLCERLSLKRNSDGGGNPGRDFSGAKSLCLDQHSEAVKYSFAEIRDLGIDSTRLNRFVSEIGNLAPASSCGTFISPLADKPLIRTSDSIIVAMPSSLTRALTEALANSISSMLGDMADFFYSKESAEGFLNGIKSRFDIQQSNIDLPATPEELPFMFPYCGNIDHGKPVLLLSFTPPLLSRDEEKGPVDGLSTDELTAFNQFLDDCCRKCEEESEFTSGLILVSLGGVGRDMVFAVPEPGENWEVQVAPFRDWLTLTEDPGLNGRRFWRFCQHQSLARHCNVHLVNPWGMLHLYAFWKENDFSLIPPQANIREGNTFLEPDPESGGRLRSYLRRRGDEHCVMTQGGDRFSRLRRHTRSLNPDNESIPIYGDIELADKGFLLGCCENNQKRWWIEGPAEAYQNPQRDLLFQIWECVLNWANKTLPEADKLLGEPLPDSILFRLDLPRLETWTFGQQSVRSKKAEAISRNVDAPSATVVLSIPEGFLNEFHQPKNVAERKIVEQLLTGAAETAGENIDESALETLVSTITGSDDARYFHVVETRELEHIDAEPGRANPNLVLEEDVKYLEIGLADLLARPAGGKIEDRESARKYLHDLCAKIWERIEQRLQKLDHGNLVLRCFHELDEVARDQFRWELSARSLSKLEEDRDFAGEILRKRMGKFAISSLANRLIIETSQYAASRKGGYILSRFDHSLLIAEFDLLVRFAAHCDAIAEGFMKPSIEVSPNGEVTVNEEFYEDVFGPYLVTRTDRDVARSVENYEKFFANSEGQGKGSNGKTSITSFASAFSAEFGFPFEALIKFSNTFAEMATAGKRRVGTISAPELRAILNRGVGLDQTQVGKFLDVLTLPIRSGWNKDMPPRTGDSDVFPWRYRRALSLYARPLVQIESTPRNWAISASFLQKAVRYLLGNLSEGRFPERLFQSDSMKSYIGHVANRRGHQFAEEVGRVFEQERFSMRLEVELTELGAHSSEGLGDVDVLAWDTSSGRIWIVECKHLFHSLTVSEAVERIQEFRGDIEKKDQLGKHLRRVAWLNANEDGLTAMTGINPRSMILKPLLVTNDLVPMQFFDEQGFPSEQFISFEDLPGSLSRP